MYSSSCFSIYLIILLKYAFGYGIGLFLQLIQISTTISFVNSVRMLQLSQGRYGWMRNDSLMKYVLFSQANPPRRVHDNMVNLKFNCKIIAGTQTEFFQNPIDLIFQIEKWLFNNIVWLSRIRIKICRLETVLLLHREVW